MGDFKQLAKRVVDSVYPSAERLENKLRSDKRLRVYIGIDPTAPDLHLGHSTNFLLLKKFQELGHKIILLVGDFTAMIGDPSGQTTARRPLTRGEVLENVKTYKEQLAKIISFEGDNPAEFRFNSQWLDELKSRELIQLAANSTIQQLLERDMFQTRLKAGNPISVHEFLYPLFQGYDSVALRVDVEVGGTDQTFNMLVGRELVKRYLNKEKLVITTKLLVNPKTGRKLMSKSEGNYISLQDEPNNMYGKVMALSDEVVFECFNLCTLLPDEEIEKIKKLKILEAKKRLAFELVKLYYSQDRAKSSQAEFERVFQKGGIPTPKEYITTKRKVNSVDFLVDSGLVSSRSEARRLISQGAVEVGGRRITNVAEEITLEIGTIARVGKFKAVEVVIR